MSTTGPADPRRESIVAALERHGVEYVVIGGAAAQARGWPEPTDDIDFTPERSQGNLSRLAAAVAELDAGFRVDPARYPDGYRPPDGIDWRTFRNQISIAFDRTSIAHRRKSRTSAVIGWSAGLWSLGGPSTSDLQSARGTEPSLRRT
jgi:hypothetical protein